MSAATTIDRLTAIVTMELRHATRDPGSYAVAFLVPILLMLLMGFGINLDINRVPIALTLQDTSAPARSLAGAYQSSKFFEVRQVATVARNKESMASGEVRGIVVIPPDFGRDHANGRGTIQVLTDGSYPNPARLLARMIADVHDHWTVGKLRDRGLSPPVPVSVERRFWFNPGVESPNFLVPGAIAVVMTVVGSFLTSLVVAREWDQGAMESLFSTPLSINEFLFAKAVPYFLLGMVAMAVCTIMALLIFQVPMRGSVLALVVLSAAYLLPALGQGLLISTVFKNQFVASQVAIITTFMPTLLLSNYVFEIAAMPVPIQLITVVVPARYFIPELLTVFLAGDDWSQFFRAIGILVLFAVSMFAVSRLATRRRIA